MANWTKVGPQQIGADSARSTLRLTRWWQMEITINGDFANLGEGAIIAVGRNQLQASYLGGDGNDLALTVC